jgi:predicted porin
MQRRLPIAIAMACVLLSAGAARADDASDLKAKFESLQKQMEAVKAQLDQVTSQLEKQKQEQQKAAAAGSGGGAVPFLKKKEGDPVTFVTPGGEVTLYGHFNVSLDDTTKGISGLQDSNTPPQTPLGRVGWMPALSTNLSYLGVRGFQKLVDDLNFVYQFETQIDITATSGTVNTNSNNSSQVKGALTSRDTFLGLSDKDWGALKFGKTDAPYKKSTARMNPFNGMIGDYAVVMGNTGGDNRVEFGTRLDKSIWYESPNWNGVSFAALYSPAQNRSLDNSNIASGETDCAGGNVPGSGALQPACNDGSYGTAYSLSLSYDAKQYLPLYLTAAYEMHKDVNRVSDQPILAPQPPGVTLYPQGYPFDVGDEYAWKIGAQYTYQPTGTTISAIYEDMKRDVPAPLQIQNERSRNGHWLAITQKVTDKDSISLGWAHAGATPGDPGQHNTSGNVTVDPATGVFGNPNPDNRANMYTLAVKHNVTKAFLLYADWALTVNSPLSHYDLGAGGRGLTTDCHDASQLAAPDAVNGGFSGNGPRCWAGGHLQGLSIGMDFTF